MAASRLRERFHLMAGVAGCITAGEIFLLLKLPGMGLLYLPLACFLAGAITLIPYREYRSVKRFRPPQPPSSSPELVTSVLRSLQPQLRAIALIPLGLAAGTSIFLLLIPPPSLNRIVPAAMMFVFSVGFFMELLRERRILSSYAPALARIVEFQPTRRSRAAVYEFESPIGMVRVKGCSLQGFEVGMTVPVLYNIFKPDESLAVPDFLFYRIRTRPL